MHQGVGQRARRQLAGAEHRHRPALGRLEQAYEAAACREAGEVPGAGDPGEQPSNALGPSRHGFESDDLGRRWAKNLATGLGAGGERDSGTPPAWWTSRVPLLK